MAQTRVSRRQGAEPGMLPLRHNRKVKLSKLPAVVGPVAGAGVGVFAMTEFETYPLTTGVVGVVLALLIICLQRMVPRSAKVGQLAREFDGRQAVRITLADVSFELVTQLGATYGYACTGTNMNSAGKQTLWFVRR
ncbi:hypothetical protein AB5J62_00200 [Amycolatopsis sp. cg5]|uniref:hypothetical protein n=1 Tax=Amycolatopsis sp. cg5 TaxID=3238802 RepID=UPI003525381C